MISFEVPKNTIKRLPIYLRILENLEEEGKAVFSSQDFESRMDIKPAVLRKDLAYFGNLGVRGQGYNVEKLKAEIAGLLGISSQVWETAIIGAGNIARALMRYGDFKRINLKIVAAFDSNPSKIGKKIRDISVYGMADMEKQIARSSIKFVILTVPGKAAEEIVARLKRTRIRGIVNFTPRYLQVSKKIKVLNINITAEILTMFYYLKRGGKK